MATQRGKYVFLMVCNDFTEARVIKSFLESEGLHPRVKDENTREIAPHFENLLGKLTMEIPEHEFVEASLALERAEHRPVLKEVDKESELIYTQALAKKSLLNSILGCIFVPVICNFVSMSLGYRVLRYEKPLTRTSRNRLLWAILFNTLAFYVWLTYGPQLIRPFLQ